jgi:hypothetical protein
MTCIRNHSYPIISPFYEIITLFYENFLQFPFKEATVYNLFYAGREFVIKVRASHYLNKNMNNNVLPSSVIKFVVF